MKAAIERSRLHNPLIPSETSYEPDFRQVSLYHGLATGSYHPHARFFRLVDLLSSWTGIMGKNSSGTAECDFAVESSNRPLLIQRGFRAVASITVPGGQWFHFPHSFLKVQSIFVLFPQKFLIFFLILALRPGGRFAHPESPWLRHCLSNNIQLE